ncbi:MAG: L,D-transpeptidase [Actinomycetota bacterium]|nr:L,D-transpeptidase [Actinomycetota bacterium]
MLHHGRRPRPPGALLLAVSLVLGVLGLAPPASAQAPDRIDAFGTALDRGSPAASGTNRTVAIASHPGGGYWTTTARGEVNSFGGAPFHGSLGGIALTQPIVAMAATANGDGYWLTASDGGVFAFGAARFHGSTGATRLNQPVVAMARTPSGNGYWLVARDGGVFSFGDAPFFGSTGGIRLNQPIVGAAADPQTGGYWLAASDGGVFAFGAPFEGSAGAIRLVSPVVAIMAEPGGRGYWLAAADGGVFTYGGAPFHGSSAGRTTAERVTVMAATAGGAGYWLLRSPNPSFPPGSGGLAVPAGSGTGRRIVYSNTVQRVWLVEEDGSVASTYAVSGRRNVPPAGTFSVFSKSRTAYAGHDGITMRNMVRFTRGETLAIGFHSIPRDAFGRPLQSENDLGGYRSAGCVRQADADSERLWDFAPVGTKVVVVY